MTEPSNKYLRRRGGTAVMPGSFNPFTKGHLDILSRALDLFERVVIAVGYNISKPESKSLAERTASELKALFIGYSVIEVVAYEGLTAEMAIEKGARCIVRGVRNTLDFEYERSLAETNRKVFGMDTVLLFADPALGFVSSSMVRELDAFGHDTTGFRVGRLAVVETLGAPDWDDTEVTDN